MNVLHSALLDKVIINKNQNAKVAKILMKIALLVLKKQELISLNVLNVLQDMEMIIKQESVKNAPKLATFLKIVIVVILMKHFNYVTNVQLDMELFMVKPLLLIQNVNHVQMKILIVRLVHIIMYLEHIILNVKTVPILLTILLLMDKNKLVSKGNVQSFLINVMLVSRIHNIKIIPKPSLFILHKKIFAHNAPKVTHYQVMGLNVMNKLEDVRVLTNILLLKDKISTES